MVENKNLAYDLSLFAEAQTVAVPQRNNVLSLPRRKALASPRLLLGVYIAVVAVLCVAAMVTFLVGKVQLHKYTVEAYRLTRQLDEAKGEGMSVQMKIHGKFSPEKVEKVAKESGMQPCRQDQVKYIQVGI